MPRINFTVRALAALRAPEQGRTIVNDSTVRGLGVLAQSTGTKSFFWSRRCNNKLEWHTIGSCADITLEQARARASEINAQVAAWREAGCVGPRPLTARRETVTLKSAFEDYCSLHLAKRSKNPAPALEYAEWQFESYLASLRAKQLAAITRSEVRDLHVALSEDHGGVTANRTVQLLRRVVNWAVRTERYAGDNPARNIELNREKRRKRFAQPDELYRLFAALQQEPSSDLCDFVKLALWTGARKSDILAMRWTDILLPDNRWTVPDTTKAGESYDIALTPEAVEILASRQALTKGTVWVFPSRGVSGHLVDLKGAYKKLLERAEITGLTQHDLRRTLGSYQAAAGTSLQIIGKSLGHSDMASTQIYAQLNLDPVRKSVLSATRMMIAASKKTVKQRTSPSRSRSS